MQKSYIKRFELAKEKYEKIINSYILVFESFENKINRYIN